MFTLILFLILSVLKKYNKYQLIIKFINELNIKPISLDNAINSPIIG